MKKTNVMGIKAFTLAVLTTLAMGCASVKPADMLTKGDPVNNIKKLAESLKKNPADQEAADVFNELYQREMNRCIDGVADTPASIVKAFSDGQGASSTFDALKVRKAAIPAGTQVWDDTYVQDVRSKLTKMENTALDFYLIQSYVEDMPAEIGAAPSYNVDEMSLLYFEDSSNRATLSKFIEGKRTDIWNSEGNFDFMCAEVMVVDSDPITDLGQLEAVYKHFKTAHSHPSNFANKTNAYNRVIEYGTKLGDGYLAAAKAKYAEKKFSAGLVDAWDARTWYKDVNSFDSKKSPCAEKELEAYYVSGEGYYAQAQDFIGSESIDDAKKSLDDAIKYFGWAKDYSNAKDRVTECENLKKQISGEF